MRSILNLLNIVRKIGNDNNLVDPTNFILAANTIEKDISMLRNKVLDKKGITNMIYKDGTIKGRFTVIE